MKKLSIKINLDKEDFYRILKVFFSITIYIVGIFSHEIYTNYIIEKATKTSTTQVLDNFSNLKSVTNLIDPMSILIQSKTIVPINKHQLNHIGTLLMSVILMRGQILVITRPTHQKNR